MSFARNITVTSGGSQPTTPADVALLAAADALVSAASAPSRWIAVLSGRSQNQCPCRACFDDCEGAGAQDDADTNGEAIHTRK